jgi:glycine/D-amino acid oxidase-like deaminating enzyme
MSSLPAKATCVVIGAGIVGNSVSYHLARLGMRDIVQLDKGPLPNPGGSTGHASNFIFPVDHTKEMTELTHESMRQYKEMGVFTGVDLPLLVALSRRLPGLIGHDTPGQVAKAGRSCDLHPAPTR